MLQKDADAADVFGKSNAVHGWLLDNVVPAHRAAYESQPEVLEGIGRISG
jgi:hypothetical protein